MLFAYFREKGQPRSKSRAKRVWNIDAVKVRSDKTGAFLQAGFPYRFLYQTKNKRPADLFVHGNCRAGSSAAELGCGGAALSVVSRAATSLSLPVHTRLVMRGLGLCTSSL